MCTSKLQKIPKRNISLRYQFLKKGAKTRRVRRVYATTHPAEKPVSDSSLRGYTAQLF